MPIHLPWHHTTELFHRPHFRYAGYGQLQIQQCSLQCTLCTIFSMPQTLPISVLMDTEVTSGLDMLTNQLLFSKPPISLRYGVRGHEKSKWRSYKGNKGKLLDSSITVLTSRKSESWFLRVFLYTYFCCHFAFHWFLSYFTFLYPLFGFLNHLLNTSCRIPPNLLLSSKGIPTCTWRRLESRNVPLCLRFCNIRQLPGRIIIL